ncbi:MAG TPA: DUF3080 family protein [Cellvibrionaceae bacterium]
MHLNTNLPIIVFASLLLVWGCQRHSPAEAQFDSYLTRLARVLGDDKPSVPRHSPPRLPDAAQLVHTLEPVSINLLDWWAFRDCGLALLLSERNSVLGRVMPPSRHLDMDARILRQLAYCKSVTDDEELLALGQNLSKQKLAQWPQRYWNATLAAPELRQFWSPSTAPLVPGKEASYSQSISALELLADLHDKLYSKHWPNIQVLEGHYQQLELYQLGGKLLQSLQVANDYLVIANQLMARAIDRHALCPLRHPTPQLQYARNVMRNYFIGELQPWLSAINQRANALLPTYRQLIAVQEPQLRTLITPHQHAVENLYNQFLTHNRQHVAHWQTLFEQCGASATNG